MVGPDTVSASLNGILNEPLKMARNTHQVAPLRLKLVSELCI